MVQKACNKNFRLYGMLPTLLGLVVAALLLNACSGDLTGPDAHSASLSSAQPEKPAISSTFQHAGAAELATFQQWITLMQQSGGTVTTYQRQYANDQQALAHASTNTAYASALHLLQKHAKALELSAMRQECVYLQQQLQQEISAWGAHHTFHDAYNNTTYALGYEYSNISGPTWAQSEVSTAKTLADYQQTVEDLESWLTNFQAMQANFDDKTPATQAHQTDLNLLQHYGYMNKRSVVVSLSEQTIRVYDHGKLVNAFFVTTGQPDLPSLPGVWKVEWKLHPTTFKSSAPEGSPDWYPDTLINYAMQYHENGYFLHDAWWRTRFGPGTNFPHYDSTGDSFASQGSHGCINMSTKNAAWLYDFVSAFTPVVVY